MSSAPRLLASAARWSFKKKVGFPLSHCFTVGVNGGDPSAASNRTRRDRAAHCRIAAAVADLGFLDSCSSYSMITNKKTN
ncbi:hypothetical protein Y032_0183g918 [Ancylostoma ceylanicum]|uniref:Uncharacterized protein n=1 Tax=Ancylostoma ceylanicum TaxID=53326 RepID=A0A016SSM6_9BILA|nr:hypothetical protein Y032_0183g918 [Ancylostoma ceylanicum]